MISIYNKIRKPFRSIISSNLILLTFLVLLILPLTTNSSALTIEDEPRPIVDYIFLNCNVITVDKNSTIAEAIAVSQGEIVAVGDSESILNNYETEDETTYDMEGRTIMPGIIDGHTHLIGSIFWGQYETLYGAQQLAMAFGYTSLTEKSIDEGQVLELQNAELNGTLRMRLNLFPIHNLASLDGSWNPVIIERWWPTENPILDHNKKVRVPGIKIYSDGASGGAKGLPAMTIPYTAQMLNDWNGNDAYGELFLNQTYLNATVKAIQDKGFSVAFHSMGDRAIATVLNAIEFALNGRDNDDYRHQIEHSSFIRPDQIVKAKNLNTIHSIRGYFPTYYQKEFEAIYPAEWEEWNINRYSLPEEGIHSYLESDFSWPYYDFDNWHTSINIRPFLHMWGMVTKNALNSTGHLHTPDPWVAEHLITREQAIQIMTIEGAYAVKQEDYLGSLEVGKYADLIVLTDDPLTCSENDIKDIEVMLTMIDGVVEYQWASHSFPKIYTRTDTTNPLGAHFIQPVVIGFAMLFSYFFVLNRKKK